MPDLAHPFEFPDVERIQADQVARLLGSEVGCSPALGPRQGSARALGQQARGLRAVDFQHRQPLPPG
ncbi:MAG: hypothetical protein QN209_10705, partial [Armatimonadota bacterium]|nr:hypothetical protein [Armatimonadota bacterium]